MNSIPLCEWRTSFAAVLFECDQIRFKTRIADALRAIDERLKSAEEIGTVERISIESAQRSLATLEQEPFFVPGRKSTKTDTGAGSNASDAEVRLTQHVVGSHVRVTLPSGVVAAEIVVIFTASSGKNILVSFDNRFMRIGPEQILDCMSAKA